jgi:hypothetical protein
MIMRGKLALGVKGCVWVWLKVAENELTPPVEALPETTRSAASFCAVCFVHPGGAEL